MRSRNYVLAVALAALAGLASAATADLTPDAAYARVIRAPGVRDAVLTPGELAACRNVLESQVAHEPHAARWAYALAHVAGAEADQAIGEAAKAKRKEALERFERAAQLQPDNLDGMLWLASACIDRVDDVGTLSQLSLAMQGRKTFEKAIALDPHYIPARVGLSRFLLNAPGIVGGSVEHAREQGEALLALPGRRGEFQGRLVLAGVAAKNQDWDEMNRQLAAAETAPGDGADPVVALRSRALYLLTKKNDPQAAAPVVARYVKAAPAGDPSALFLEGEVKRQLGRCDDALPRYNQVLSKLDNARGSRWGAAVCHEQLGQIDEARRDYEEFARRFPSDDRAKEAKAAVKRLTGS